MQFTIPIFMVILTAIFGTLAKASSSSTTEIGAPGSSLPTDIPLRSPKDRESENEQSTFSSSSTPNLRVIPGGLNGQRRKTISISLDAYLPKRPEHIRIDTISQISELNNFDYQSLDGMDADEFAEVEQRPGFWSASRGWESLWQVVSRYMEAPDTINDKLLFEACVLDKVSLFFDSLILSFLKSNGGF